MSLPTKSPVHDITPVLDQKDLTSTEIHPVELDGYADKDAPTARHLFNYQDGERLKRKADIHLLSILACCYLLKNIDQHLVSYVLTINTGEPGNILNMLDMNRDQYAYANTVFTVFFILAEIPSNLMIKWATPRLHFVRIITLWSITCACTAAVSNMGGFLAMRGLLGLFEGGLWPGILFQLTAWYRPDEIAVRATALITLGLFSNIIDAFLTYGISHIDGRGMAGWQWAFVICGLLGIFLATLVFFCLPDWPDSPPSRRQFLTPDEAAFMVARLPPNASKSTDKNFDWQAIKADLKDGLLWSFGGVMMFAQVGTTGLNFWLPTIVQSFGLAGRNNSVLLTIPSSVLYIIVSISFGFYIDRQSAIPKPIFMICAQVAIIGVFIGLMICTNTAGLFALIMLAYIPYAIYQTCIIPMRAMSTKGSSSAAFAYAFQNVCGNSVNLYSAQIFQAKYAPRYVVSFGVCVAFFAASIGAVCSMWYFSKEIEKRTRVILRERRAAGRNGGEVIEADVDMKKY